jgi:hypothetical protein
MVKLTCLASCTAVALLLFVTGPAFAEFQIQEAGIEKGEVELEYRGAYHWGVPQVTNTNENANDLVQSHEFELQMGVTDWWLLSETTGLDQPLGESLQGNAVEIETEFALLKRQGDGIALSLQTGYEQAFNHGAQVDGDANQFGFGPIVELAKGPFLLTLNPLFTKQIGTFADQEGLGFEYGWRGEYDFTSAGVLAWKCSERLRIWRTQVRSIARLTALVPHCSTISAEMKTRLRAVTKMAAKLKPGTITAR